MLTNNRRPPPETATCCVKIRFVSMRHWIKRLQKRLPSFFPHKASPIPPSVSPLRLTTDGHPTSPSSKEFSSSGNFLSYTLQYAIPLVLCICAGHTMAHDLWIDRNGSNHTLYQGHVHSAHIGAAVVPYNPAIVASVLCQKTGGSATAMAFSSTHPVKFTGNCASVLVSVSSGYWTKTVWDTKNTPKIGISGVLKSWKSEESVKLINQWTPASTRPVTKGLEITPLSDPFKLAVGDKITVLVTDNGKPKAGVPVAYQGNTRGTSGDDGRISLRIRKVGMQLISASTETPLADGKADLLIRATTLQFGLVK